MQKIVKVPIQDVDPGMVIVRCDKSGVPFAHYGQPLPSIEAAKQLLNFGVSHVFVKQAPASVAETPAPAATPAAASAKPAGAIGDMEFIKNIERLRKEHDRAVSFTKKLLLGARHGVVPDFGSAMGIVGDFVMECMRDLDVFASITHIKSRDEYEYYHSVNVCALSIAIGRKMGLSPRQLTAVGLAGLLCDIGKTKIPERILNKPGKLNDKEFELIKKHTEYGYQILKKDPQVPGDTLIAVLQHHEKPDGTGYPNGLVERQISKFAKIISMADTYDAITSDSAHRKGVTSIEALRMMFGLSNSQSDQVLVKFLISLMGVYPVGTLVLLDNDSIGIVFETNHKTPMSPKVLVVSDMVGTRIPAYLLDLSSPNGGDDVKIVVPVDSNYFGIDPYGAINDYLKQNSPSN